MVKEKNRPPVNTGMIPRSPKRQANCLRQAVSYLKKEQPNHQLVSTDCGDDAGVEKLVARGQVTMEPPHVLLGFAHFH